MSLPRHLANLVLLSAMPGNSKSGRKPVLLANGERKHKQRKRDGKGGEGRGKGKGAAAESAGHPSAMATQLLQSLNAPPSEAPERVNEEEEEDEDALKKHAKRRVPPVVKAAMLRQKSHIKVCPSHAPWHMCMCVM